MSPKLLVRDNTLFLDIIHEWIDDRTGWRSVRTRNLAPGGEVSEMYRWCSEHLTGRLAIYFLEELAWVQLTERVLSGRGAANLPATGAMRPVSLECFFDNDRDAILFALHWG